MPRGRLKISAIDLVAACALMLFVQVTKAAATGQLPLISEDPSSPCAQTLNTDVAYSLDLVGPGRDQLGRQQFRSHVDMSAPIVQLNYGITGRVQARVESENAVTTVAPDNGGLATGIGDTTVGLKYRFMDQSGGYEFSDACDPHQSDAGFGLVGPVSLSIFPQFTFPSGSERQGLGAGEYEVEFPLDVAWEIGNWYLVGEGDFIWNYHDRTSPNEFDFGIAAYYSITDNLDLLGEQRVDIETADRGPTVWLMNLGASYQWTDRLGIFGSVGTSVGATSTVAASYVMTIVGVVITEPVPW